MKKAIIGVVSKNITLNDFYDWSWQRISNDVRYSVNKNGGLVMGILPQTTRKIFNQSSEPENIALTETEKTDLITLLNMCDGIILPGGITSHNYEEFIAKYCYDNDIPLLGICSGYNSIIRGLGGKAEKNQDTDIHDRPDLTYAHKCIITDKDSLFAKIVKEDVFDVNSVHSYIGTHIPNELAVVAKSDDGQVEVVEAKDKKFYIGIKYHPELLVDIDKKQNDIFTYFLNVCSNHSKSTK